MSYIEETIIKEMKSYIEEGNLKMIINKYNEYINETHFEFKTQWDYIFSKIYIHSCLKKHPNISKWLKENIYNNFDEFTKIAIKHVINYGNYLMNK
jgi:hypothetical protein